MALIAARPVVPWLHHPSPADTNAGADNANQRNLPDEVAVTRHSQQANTEAQQAAIQPSERASGTAVTGSRTSPSARRDGAAPKRSRTTDSANLLSRQP